MLSDNIRSIGSGAFDHGRKIKATYYTGTQEQWETIAIDTDNENLTRKVIFNYGKTDNVCGENAKWFLNIETYELTISGTGDIDPESANWDDIKDIVTHITIEDGINSLGENVFDGFTSLEKIDIPESVTYVGDYAFNNCSSLTIVEIPDGVTYVGAFAFNNCKNIKNLIIPTSVENIGEDILSNNSSYDTTYYTGTEGKWNSITVGDSNDTLKNNIVFSYSKYEGFCGSNASWLYDEDTKTLTISGTGKITDGYKGWWQIKSEVQKVEIADGITVIGEAAFGGWTSLESVTLGYGITRVGDSAFAGCYALTDVSYNGDIADWCNIDFYYNPMQCGSGNLYLDGKLVEGEIVIPEGVTVIPTGAFSNCSKITSVRLPDGLRTISYAAFRNCTSMTDINIPEGVTWIGTSAFEDCTGLTDITVPGTADRIDTGAFKGCTSLKTVELSAGLVETGLSMFENCTSLTTVIMPETLTKVYGSTFKSCTSLETVELPDSVTNISGSAFWGCRELKNLKLSENLVQIGDHAFGECNSLESVIIPESVTNINYIAFSGCENLKTVVLPENLIELGTEAFRFCYKLTSINIPDTITAIPEGLFFYCKSLENIEIPESVTSIGEAAFSGCRSLKNVILPVGLTNIETRAFHECRSLTEFTVPEGVKSIGESAFFSCLFLEATYYTGTEEQWNEIDIASGNDALTRKVVFNYGKPTDACGENARWVFDETSGALTINGTGEIDANFANWDQIKDQVTYVEVENGITSVGESAFVDFTALQEVYFSESVLTVGADAFSGCENLAIVTILADNVSLANSAFKNTDSRLFFVVKSGSQTHSAVAGAGYAVTPFSVGTEEVMENLKTLVFEGRFVFYESLDYNYISKLMLNLPDLYYVKFEKMVLDGVMSLPDFSVDLEIPEENIELDEEYLTLKDVYISVMIDGEKVSFEELRERVANGDYSGFIFTNYVEDGVNSSFFESVAEFFGQLEESLQGAVEFVTAAFNAFKTTVSKIWKKLFG